MWDGNLSLSCSFVLRVNWVNVNFEKIIDDFFSIIQRSLLNFIPSEH